MKKVLSLVLAFAMILGSFGFVFASDFPDVKDTEYYSEPVNVLSGLGVIGGFPDGTFGPEKEVTRAQMATMIVNALGMTVTGQADTKFSDVPKAHWASGFINYAASVGFIAGFPDGTFKPDIQVTYDQALTMIVAALGYKAEALTGTWPGNFVNQARGLGILDTCKTTGTANAPRQDIACFLYDALESYIGTTNKDGDFNPTMITKDKYDCMLYRLGAEDYTPEGGDAGDPFVVTGGEPSLINLANYKGAYITALSNKKDGKIVAVKEVKSEFIEGTYDDLDEAYKLNGKDATAVIFFDNGDENGKIAMSDGSLADVNLKVAVALDGKKVTDVYSIQAWVADESFYFTEDMADEIIDEKTLNTAYDFELDDDDEIDVTSFEIVGADNLESIKKDDVVTVYVGTKYIRKIEVSDKTVDGTITKIGTGTDPAYTIAGAKYYRNIDAEKTPAELKKLMTDGTEAKFFLTYGDEIFDFDAEEETTADYAIVLATGKDSSRYGTNTPYIKLFTADGAEAEFAATAKITYNDTKDTAIAYDTDNTWDMTPALDAGTLVKYEVNSKDQVVSLELFALGGAAKFDAKGICNNTALKDSTVIFSYKTGATDPSDAGNYAVLKAADLFKAEATKMACDVDSGNFTAVYVQGISENDTVYAFFGKTTGTDASGEVWSMLYDGEVKEMSVEEGEAGAVYTTGDSIAYKLTFDTDGVVTKAEAVDLDEPAEDRIFTEPTLSGKFSCTGGVFKIGDKSYTLDDEVAVYCYDVSDKAWTALKDSALSGKAGAFNYVALFDTNNDGSYDIVIVTKP